MNLKRFGFNSFLEDEETVISIFRRPFVPVFGKIIFYFVLWGGLAFGLWFFLPTNIHLVWIVPVIVGFYKIFTLYVNWYVNAIVMTEVGLTFVEWPSLFQKQSTRVDFFDLDQVGVLKLGFKSYAGNYGTLQFFQAGGNIFEIKGINRPNRVARIIEKQKEKAVDDKNFTEESALKHLLSQLVLTHVKEHGVPTKQGVISPEMIEYELSDEHPIDTDVADVEVEVELDDEGGVEIDFDKKKEN